MNFIEETSHVSSTVNVDQYFVEIFLAIIDVQKMSLALKKTSYKQ